MIDLGGWEASKELSGEMYPSMKYPGNLLLCWHVTVTTGIDLQLPVRIYNVMLTVAQCPGADGGTGQICGAAGRPHPALVFVSGFQLTQMHSGGVWRKLESPHGSWPSFLLTRYLVTPGVLRRSRIPWQDQRGLIDRGQFHTHRQLWGQTTGTLIYHHLVNDRCSKMAPVCMACRLQLAWVFVIVLCVSKLF